MKRFFYIFICFIILIQFTACKGSEEDAEKAYINYNLESEPSSLDPQIASDQASHIVVMNMFEGLVRINPDGKVLPGVAESWEANNDFTTFTFKLRKDAVWSNQQKTSVTARDFVFAFRRALSPQTNSSAKSSLYCVKNSQAVSKGTLPEENLGIVAKDDSTLVINLEYPYQDFPKVTALSVAMPCNEEFFNQSKGQYGLECNSTICNGPYKFSNKYSWDHAKSISLSKNLDYHGHESAIPQGINFSINSEGINGVNAIKNSSVDAAPILGDELTQTKENNMNLASFEDTTWCICFNTADPVFGNINVRSGFLKSLDRDYVLKTLAENYTVANDIITSETTVAGENYRNLAGGNFYLKPSDSALNQLNTGLKQTSQKTLPNITIYCPDTTGIKSVAGNILEILNRNLGMYFNMTPLPIEELNSKVASGDYKIAIIPLKTENDGPLEVLSAFKSDNQKNPAKLKDSKYDKIINKISEARGKDSIPYCVEAEKYLNDNAILYPLLYEKQYFASASNVSGIVFHPYGAGIDFMFARKEKKS